MMPENIPSLDPMRHSRDHWKCQALIYMKELAIVNRACERKSRHIRSLRDDIKWMKNVLDLQGRELRGEGEA